MASDVQVDGAETVFCEVTESAGDGLVALDNCSCAGGTHGIENPGANASADAVTCKVNIFVH